MAYVLTVTNGADEGKTFTIEGGDCVIGRSPSNTVVLQDDTVAWEHVRLREEHGHLLVENLSAQGTRVKGRRVTDQTRLGTNGEIELSDQCRLTFELKVDKNTTTLTTILAVVLAGAVLVALAVGVFLGTGESTAVRPITDGEWRRAYDRIDDRINEWSSKGWFPPEGVTLFRDAWRLDRAGTTSGANEKWVQLQSMFLAQRMPGPVAESRTIAQAAGTTPRALFVIMGHDRSASYSNLQWSSEEAVADALAWFVSKRALGTSGP